ncbi:hypothetical protein [Streptomyces sp. NPDC006739]|uniref:hypothetical protein n=1 Tax=Streptomyces sp. NPDC006739 TaxID=3364763 RepID=UPI0036876EFA
MIRQRIVLVSTAGLASVLLLAACGSSNDTATNASAGSAAPTATAPSHPTASASAGRRGSASRHRATTTSLKAEAVNGVGSVVTDDHGMTLYRYDKDQSHPSKWTCAGACTKTWMPVIVHGPLQTAGVDRSLLGTVHRKGRKQLTLAGWPLYRYMGDTAAGQANGEGKDGQWYAVTPSGGKSTKTG